MGSDLGVPGSRCGAFLPGVCSYGAACAEKTILWQGRGLLGAWDGERGGVMMVEVSTYRRGGVVLQRTAGHGDLAGEEHRTAVPLEVNASVPT